MLRKPYIGVLLSIFEYFTHPQYRYWGDHLPDIRYPMIISSVLCISFVLNYRQVFLESRGKNESGVGYLMFYWVNMIFVWLLYSVNSDATMNAVIDYAQLIIFYFLIVNLFNDKVKIDYVLMLLIFGYLYFSYEAWGKSLREGRLEGIGGAGSRDANHLANDMLAVIPFIGTYFLYGNNYQKLLVLFAAPFILNLMILCNSRGAYLGLAGAGVVYILMCSVKNLKKVLPIASVGVILFFSLTDQRFDERFFSITEYKEDSSSSQRLQSWEGAIRMLKDHPLGTGESGFSYLSPIYIPEIVESYDGNRRNVHNTPLSVLTSWGYIGGILFFLFHLYTYRLLFKTRNFCKQTNDEKGEYLAVAMISGLFGFLVAAMFGIRQDAPVLLWMTGLSAAMYNVFKKDYMLSSDDKESQNET